VLVIIIVIFLFFIFAGNPLEEKHSSDGDWKDQVALRLKKLKKLDGK